LTLSRANALVSIFSTMHLVRRAAKDAAHQAHHIPWQWFNDDEEDEAQPDEDQPKDAEEEEDSDGVEIVESEDQSAECF
jgi:hypothetical protein